MRLSGGGRKRSSQISVSILLVVLYYSLDSQPSEEAFVVSDNRNSVHVFDEHEGVSMMSGNKLGAQAIAESPMTPHVTWRDGEFGDDLNELEIMLGNHSNHSNTGCSQDTEGIDSHEFNKSVLRNVSRNITNHGSLITNNSTLFQDLFSGSVPLFKTNSPTILSTRLARSADSMLFQNIYR